MARCVYCETSENLNTQLTVTLEDGTKAAVDICDEHAEEATIKSARAAYQANQDKIAAFLIQAKELGLEVQEGASGLVIVRPEPVPVEPVVEPVPVAQPVEQQMIQTQPAMVEQPTNPKAGLTKNERDEGWVDTGAVDGQKGMQSVGGSTNMGAVSTHASHVVGGQKDVLPSNARRGKVKMQLAEGRGGQPIAIPEKRIDGTGTTRIKIQQKVNDDVLQRRFKDMATESRSSDDNQAGVDFRNSYQDTTRRCPICRGECVINGADCPKCDGMGTITIS